MANEQVIHQLFLTELCNQNCLFCSYDRKSVNKKDPSLAQLKEIIGKIPHNPGEIVIDGGEPTIRKEFFEIVALAKGRNPRKITLCTNGLMLSYPEFAKKVKFSGITQVLISLHSHKSEIADRITRVEGSFSKTVKGVKNLVKEGVIVSLSFVINELNYKEILEYVQFTDKEFGKTHITFSFVMPSGNALVNKWTVPKISTVVPYLKTALKYCVDKGISFSFTGCSIPPCFLKGYEQYTGEFLLRDNKYLMERESGERIRKISEGKVKPESCRSCEYDSVCGGLWEKYVEMYGDGEIKKI